MVRSTLSCSRSVGVVSTGGAFLFAVGESFRLKIFYHYSFRLSSIKIQIPLLKCISGNKKPASMGGRCLGLG
jgi:hypothetical protein